MKKPLFLAVLIALLQVQIGCGQTPRYHLSREEIVPAPSFNKNQVCQLPGVQCAGDDGKRIDTALNFIAERFPTKYFDNNAESNERKRTVKPFVEISSLPAKKKEEREPKSFFTSISPEGQKAIFEYLSNNSQTVTADVATLSKLLSTLAVGEANKHPALAFDPRIEVGLNVSSLLNSGQPADRLESLHAFIVILRGGKVAGAEKLETEKTVLQFGKQTDVTDTSSSVDIGFLKALGIGGEPIKYQYKNTLERVFSRELARKNIAINADRDIIVVSQDGLEGIDLRGNVFSNLSLDIDSAQAAVLAAFTEIKIGADGNLQYRPQDETYWNIPSIEAIAFWVAQVRTVLYGEDTVSEGDDVIAPVIYNGFVPLRFWTNPKSFYTITLNYGTTPQSTCKRARLVFKEHGRPVRTVGFTDFNDARMFQRFLLAMYEKLKSAGLNQNQITSIKISNDIEVGFALDLQGNENKDVVNIIWKDKSGNLADLEKARVDLLRWYEYPLKKVFDANDCLD